MEILYIIVAIIVALFVLLILASTAYHQYQLKVEARKYKPQGMMVQVQDKDMHVYSKGSGSKTLVFLSGHGTSNPVLDFKPLWMRLQDEYRIVVVEKAGYGWSETSKSPRDVDTLLTETRKALTLAGEKGPFVLVPHSMSGLEAIYWGQNYPQEITAILGLDPSIPEVVEMALKEGNRMQMYFMYFISRIGLARFMPEDEVIAAFPLMKSDDLTGAEKEEYMAVFYKSAFSKNMLREVDFIEENGKKVQALGVPEQIPMYFFISNGLKSSGTAWRKALSEYVSQRNKNRYMFLDCSHYLHYEKAPVIAEEMKTFLETLSKR